MTFVDPEHAYADKGSITCARVHNCKKLLDMIDDKNALYAFDREDLDYKDFDGLCENSVGLATRLKGYSVYELVSRDYSRD